VGIAHRLNAQETIQALLSQTYDCVTDSVIHVAPVGRAHL